jgi:sirohydrochlorin ferrochelatase
MSHLLLLAHGSRRTAGNTLWRRLLDDLQAELGNKRVALGFLELTEPTFDEALTSLYQTGAREVRLLPLFLTAGAHVTEDIPRLCGQATDQFPDLKIDILPPLGETPDFWSLLHRLGREALEPTS